MVMKVYHIHTIWYYWGTVLQRIPWYFNGTCLKKQAEFGIAYQHVNLAISAM